MPAIRPALLKHQVTALSTEFNQPEVFTQQLHNLLDHYADRTHRSGQTGKPNPLMESYNAPSPVIRQIINILRTKVDEDYQLTLGLSDRLWIEPNLECRILAAYLLGWVKGLSTASIISRVAEWLIGTVDDQIIRIVIDHGLAHVRQVDSQAVLDQAQEWLQSTETIHQKYGLIALETMLADTGFKNLPAVFLMVTPFFRKVPVDLRADLVRLITCMAQRSPQETTYLLQENLRATENPDTAWLIRHLLAGAETSMIKMNSNDLPEEMQKNLRQALRDQIQPSK